MDPNETLKRIRELVAEYNDHFYYASNREPIAAGIIELVEALDEWMSKGGFSPWGVEKVQAQHRVEGYEPVTHCGYCGAPVDPTTPVCGICRRAGSQDFPRSGADPMRERFPTE